MKPIHIAPLIMLCSAIACLALPPALEAPSKNKTTLLRPQQIEQWREDIDFMQQQLELRHIHLYHQISADFFSNELTRIKQQLPTLTETNLKIELMRLIKQVRDGHTQFAYWGGEHHHYPLELRMFGEEFGYQDAGTFSLPHSGWTVMYSKRRYRFQDSESEGVEPDVKIDLDWDSYHTGKDKQFDWILNNIQSRHHIISQQSYHAPNRLVQRAF